MEVIKEIRVEKECKISDENPTPSKYDYTETLVNVTAKNDADGFVNFTFGAELEQCCCEDFIVEIPEKYEYDEVYVSNITVLKDYSDYYNNVIINILIREDYTYEYKYLTFIVSNDSDFYTHTVRFNENNELIYESEV